MEEERVGNLEIYLFLRNSIKTLVLDQNSFGLALALDFGRGCLKSLSSKGVFHKLC